MMIFMNTSNPFQIPVCLQRADSQQRRRERFKRGFIAAVAAIVVLLVGLLIEGCMTEKTTIAAPTPGQKITVQPAPQANPDSVAAQKPNQVSPPTQNATRQSAAPAASENTVTSSPTRTIYVVKSGDTLTRIAKVHGTTVKALKTANNLNNDRIVVGAKLKIPEA
jgi:LysM repeat protein